MASRSFSSVARHFLTFSLPNSSFPAAKHCHASESSSQAPTPSQWMKWASSFLSKRLLSSLPAPSFCKSSSSQTSPDASFDSRKPIGKVADRPKARPPSTPLSFLGKSRSTRNREAAAERGTINADQPFQPLSRRWRAAQQANKIPKKKKKRPPPGPVQFENLTAETPVHSDLPFAFRHSYTEIPKVAPVGFQEKFSPFGPGRLDRYWDGQAALPIPSIVDSVQGRKKEKDEFDSFNPPPRKKGIKPVTPPGPFLPGKGPKRAKTREEILGEPLTKEEITELVEHCIRSKKQINLGRDGLTHNMLNDFYNHWKRERAIRVKCKGVSTMDMENVCYQLEDKTGGKIIQRAGGTLYLFRGRNYNHRDRPYIPPMLWKPHSPIYPKLITQKPGGLKLKEANELRKQGLKIMPLTKLAKNGYYGDLVQHTREAFEDDDLVRIDCKGLNTSDYKKIGAKLRDLVPCILLSFQREQIVLWKGRDKKASNAGSIAEDESVETQRNEAAGSCKNADISNDSYTYVTESGGTSEGDGNCGDAEVLNDNTKYAMELTYMSESTGEAAFSDCSETTSEDDCECGDVEVLGDNFKYTAETIDTSKSADDAETTSEDDGNCGDVEVLGDNFEYAMESTDMSGSFGEVALTDDSETTKRS